MTSAKSTVFSSAFIALSLVLAGGGIATFSGNVAAAEQSNNHPSRAVVAYVAPSATFPPEGGAPGTVPSPLIVYDQSKRTVAGVIRAERFAGCQPQDVCPWKYILALATGRRIELQPVMWAYETSGIAIYEKPQRGEKGMVWAPLMAQGDRFWVSVRESDIKWYTSLVYLVEDQKLWCKSVEACEAVPAEMTREMERVAQETTCYSTPYLVQKVVSTKKGPFYELALPKDPDKPVKTWLPPRMFTPVFDENGQHTGSFYAKGC